MTNLLVTPLRTLSLCEAGIDPPATESILRFLQNLRFLPADRADNAKELRSAADGGEWMFESFWKNWRVFLDHATKAMDPAQLIEPSPTVPAMIESALEQAPAPVTADERSAPPTPVETFEAPSVESGTPIALATPIALETIVLPTVECRRLRVPALRVGTHCVTFGDAGPPPARSAHAKAGSKASMAPMAPRKPLPRVAPPSNVPIRERLLAVLQPPLSILFNDNCIWLPFEPFPYQYEGIHFLYNRWSALLGDEMGLGKTMQTIMAIRLLLRSGQARSIMLVCPKPLVSNWRREFSLWAEEIPITEIRGETQARRFLWIHDRNPIKIANYESLTRDENIFDEAGISFDLVVLDEAQRIKNREGKTAKVIHKLRRKRSWALTGTPVENRATDLVSLLDFVTQERTEFGDRADALREATAKVLLRRTKDMVLDDLPPKMVRDIHVDLGAGQREIYDAMEKEGVYKLDDLGEAITVEHVFDLIRRLKQICNFHPLTGESAKADQLRADLEEIVASGQKAILFSQWVDTIEKLADRLPEHRPLLYHGKIPNRERDDVLRRFRQERDRPLLLMTYGVGAVGLNLQFANYVFLFDRWWNPAIEDQAINRAHRIGQREPVFVSRLITPRTIEERIAEVLDRKRALFSELIDDHEPLASSGLTRDEVFGLFDLKLRPRSAA